MLAIGTPDEVAEPTPKAYILVNPRIAARLK